jgi:hypothetical protein
LLRKAFLSPSAGFGKWHMMIGDFANALFFLFNYRGVNIYKE